MDLCHPDCQGAEAGHQRDAVPPSLSFMIPSDGPPPPHLEAVLDRHAAYCAILPLEWRKPYPPVACSGPGLGVELSPD